MGALNAADAKKWMDTARKVLEALLAHPPEAMLTRTELLGPQEPGTALRRQMNIFYKLEASGVITGVRGSYRTDPVRWGLNDPARAKELVANSALLSEALWPPAAIPEPEEPEPTPEESAEASAAAAADDSSAEVLGALAAVLKALSAIGTSLGQLHEKVDKVATSCSSNHANVLTSRRELADRIQLVDEGVDKLLERFRHVVAASAPRLGELEAKQLKEGDILNYHYAVGGVGPVRVVSVRSAPGAPVCVNVAFLDDKPGKPGTVLSLTPKFLSHRSVT